LSAFGWLLSSRRPPKRENKKPLKVTQNTIKDISSFAFFSGWFD
jgi:hypothetical protein